MTSSLFDLKGRTAIVVGGTTGIGHALALGLADAGADVVATGRRRDVVDKVAGEIEARGRRTLRHATDVSDLASLRALRDACLAAFTHIDIVVAAAGTTKRVPTLDMTEADADEAIRTRRGTGRCRRISFFRSRHLRHRPAARRRWRTAWQWSQPVNAVLVISERDNVATALETIDAGREIRAGGTTVVAA